MIGHEIRHEIRHVIRHVIRRVIRHVIRHAIRHNPEKSRPHPGAGCAGNDCRRIGLGGQGRP